jgi:hypothetical protein
VKPALVDPVGTVTDVGTETAALLLVKLTAVSLVAAASKVTVQTSEVVPVAELLEHVNPVRLGPGADVPVPLRLTESGVGVEELVIAN